MSWISFQLEGCGGVMEEVPRVFLESVDKAWHFKEKSSYTNNNTV